MAVGFGAQLGFCAAEKLKLLEMPFCVFNIILNSPFTPVWWGNQTPPSQQPSGCSSRAAGTFGSPGTHKHLLQSLPHMFSFPEFLSALAHFSCACPSHLLTLTWAPPLLRPQVWLIQGWL